MNFEDAVLDEFRFLKGLIAKYGVEHATDLVALGDRLVADGAFKSRVEAVKAIEAIEDQNQ